MSVSKYARACRGSATAARQTHRATVTFVGAFSGDDTSVGAGVGFGR